MLVGSDSSIFSNAFSPPRPQDVEEDVEEDVEGQTDETPIVLGEDFEQFEALMRVLYPS